MSGEGGSVCIEDDEGDTKQGAPSVHRPSSENIVSISGVTLGLGGKRNATRFTPDRL